MPDLPWEKLGGELSAAGWLDLNNHRGRLTAGGLDIALAGVHDPHADRDRYEAIAGPADPAADLRLGVLHSPEPAVMDLFAADGYDLLLAGHTHGGQLRVPGFGALTTNCGIDRARVKGLSMHPEVSPYGGQDGLALHLGRARHFPVGARQVRLPPGGDPADAGPPLVLNCPPGGSRQRAQDVNLSAKLTEVRPRGPSRTPGCGAAW